MSRTAQQKSGQQRAAERRAFVQTLTELQNENTQLRMRLRQTSHLLAYMMVANRDLHWQPNGTATESVVVPLQSMLDIEQSFQYLSLDQQGEGLLEVTAGFQAVPKDVVEAEVVDGGEEE